MTNVITLGETMLRLTPPDHQLIEQSTVLHWYVGGCESNVAVGLARLGWDVKWFSRLTGNALGYKIVRVLQAQGVDVSAVVWTPNDRVGVYYVEEGASPRGSRAIYDRVGSAMSNIQPADLPDNLFASNRLGWLHTSGIMLALSQSAAETGLAAIHQAKAAGWQVCFDVNYREMLWTPIDAATSCAQAIQYADVVILALRDAVRLFNTPEDPILALEYLRGRFTEPLLVMTLGAEGACCLTTKGEFARQTAFATQGKERVGAGDAFAAGFLSSYMAHGNAMNALAWGTAAAAYKYTIPGDMPLLDRTALESLIYDTHHNETIRR